MPNQKHGELYVDAIPGLGYALAAPPQPIEFTATLTDNITITTTVTVPIPFSAVCLKLFSNQPRAAGKDIRDIWRLLAVCHETGIMPADRTGSTPRRAHQILTDLTAIDGKPLA